jgi:hypothetical protein
VNTPGLRIGFGLAIVGALVTTVTVRAQELSLNLSAGRVVYQPVSASAANTIMGTLRYDAPSGAWVYGTGAAPLRSDLSWGGGGAGGRFLPPGSESRRANVGVDIGAHAFLFRDDVASMTGRGATIEALPFVGVGVGSGRVELRGGWRGQALSTAAATERRGVFETGARASYGRAIRVEADARWVRADGAMYPFAGGTLSYAWVPVQVWMQAGRWMSADLDDVAWGAGVGVSLGTRATLWASARQDAPDPLYWNATRRSWSVGVTRRLGRPAPLVLPAPRQIDGRVVIEVSASDAPGNELVVAGDFSNWQPVVMRREGDRWTTRLTLAPGVYHYAFRSGSGDWFVPASTRGRRSDGMGGYVALLVVS